MEWSKLSEAEKTVLLKRKRAIAKRRTQLDMTQQELADMVGRTRENISRIERGRLDPGEELTNALEEVLGYPMCKLLPDIYFKKTGQVPEHLMWLTKLNFEREVCLQCQGF